MSNLANSAASTPDDVPKVLQSRSAAPPRTSDPQTTPAPTDGSPSQKTTQFPVLVVAIAAAAAFLTIAIVVGILLLRGSNEKVYTYDSAELPEPSTERPITALDLDSTADVTFIHPDEDDYGSTAVTGVAFAAAEDEVNIGADRSAL